MEYKTIFCRLFFYGKDQKNRPKKLSYIKQNQC